MFKLPRFVKRFLRKHTRPKTKEYALGKSDKISLLYAVITWNLLGVVVYKIVTKRADVPAEERLSDGRYFARILGIENAKLVRFSGFSKVGEWDLVEEKKKHGKLLTKLELAQQLEEEQKLQNNQEDQEQHQESDLSESEDLDVKRPL